MFVSGGTFRCFSAVVFIEKQFQIPSRLSGTMVSAGDFAYIPVVIFTSYFGGKVRLEIGKQEGIVICFRETEQGGSELDVS